LLISIWEFTEEHSKNRGGRRYTTILYIDAGGLFEDHEFMMKHGKWNLLDGLNTFVIMVYTKVP
jgi:hypothetical protein